MQHDFTAYALGATLYMPVLHPSVMGIATGRTKAPASSIVLCLEDALAADDVARGLDRLKFLLPLLRPDGNTRLFVRPRGLDMARDLCGLEGIGRLAGFVAPKVRPETAPAWLDLAAAAGLKVMPTLESAEYFDPARIVAFRDVLDSHERGVIAAVRIGGNDLLGALALRREPGKTSWEGPLAWVLGMASSILTAGGYAVAAPVHDVIHDLKTLRREVERDVAAGFVSKTAIHPAQVPVIEEAMRVTPEDLARAEAILADDARAVFQIGNVMCEPSTHRGWAERTVARARISGIILRDFEDQEPAVG